METSTFMDFIKARWRIIAISIVVGLVVILAILYMVRLLVLPAEITSSSGAITYYANNST